MDKRGFYVSEKHKGRTIRNAKVFQVCLRVTIMGENDG